MNRHSQAGIAQLLASKGREGDTMLVHMAPSEVAGLQQLARSKGTSLTINPHTGLPEAKNLWDYLGSGSGYGSLIAGVLGGAAGLDPSTVGLLTGASQVISSHGDFAQGVLSGMSAYGGAGIGQELSGVLGGLGNKLQKFEQGFRGITPTTPTTPITPGTEAPAARFADTSLSNAALEDKYGFGAPKAKLADSVLSNAELEDKYGFGTPQTTLQAPEELAKTLTAPTTIEAKQAAQATQPTTIWDRLRGGYRAAFPTTTPTTTEGGIGSLNASQLTQLKTLGDLKANGTITAAEFEAQKAKLLTAAKPDQAANMMKYWQLGMLAPAQHNAAQQQKDAEAADAAAQAKMAAKPVTYTSGVGFHQVRNPKYGQPGQPMYIQYYDKGTQGSTFTGPGQGGVREMTPSETERYQQTGKFTPDDQVAKAASGGLGSIIKSKTKHFADGGATGQPSYGDLAGTQQYYQDLYDRSLQPANEFGTADLTDYLKSLDPLSYNYTGTGTGTTGNRSFKYSAKPESTGSTVLGGSTTEGTGVGSDNTLTLLNDPNLTAGQGNFGDPLGNKGEDLSGTSASTGMNTSWFNNPATAGLGTESLVTGQPDTATTVSNVVGTDAKGDPVTSGTTLLGPGGTMNFDNMGVPHTVGEGSTAGEVAGGANVQAGFQPLGENWHPIGEMPYKGEDGKWYALYGSNDGQVRSIETTNLAYFDDKGNYVPAGTEGKEGFTSVSSLLPDSAKKWLADNPKTTELIKQYGITQLLPALGPGAIPAAVIYALYNIGKVAGTGIDKASGFVSDLMHGKDENDPMSADMRSRLNDALIGDEDVAGAAENKPDDGIDWNAVNTFVDESNNGPIDPKKLQANTGSSNVLPPKEPTITTDENGLEEVVITGQEPTPGYTPGGFYDQYSPTNIDVGTATDPMGYITHQAPSPWDDLPAGYYGGSDWWGGSYYYDPLLGEYRGYSGGGDVDQPEVDTDDVFSDIESIPHSSKSGKGVLDKLRKIKAAKKGTAPSAVSPSQVEYYADRIAQGSPSSYSTSSSYAQGGIAGYAQGGVPVGYYKAGGKLLDGPGDGMSDSIPAMITGQKPQRAALADGEFVVPADVVSHLGNGSTKAGAKKLYAMMDNIRKARTGRKKQAPQIKADKFLPR